MVVLYPSSTSQSVSPFPLTHPGRPAAYRIVQALVNRVIESGGDLRQAALQDAQMQTTLSPEEIDHALDPGRYLGSTDAFINKALESYREVQDYSLSPIIP